MSTADALPTDTDRSNIMRTPTPSHARRIVSRISATWAELDHAQRRLFEIQTGTTGLTPTRIQRARASAGHRESHL